MGENNATARALRRAGFVRLSTKLWVTPDQLDVIMRMASGNLDTINAIKRQVRGDWDDGRLEG